MRKRRHPEPEELAAPGAESSEAGVDQHLVNDPFLRVLVRTVS